MNVRLINAAGPSVHTVSQIPQAGRLSETRFPQIVNSSWQGRGSRANLRLPGLGLSDVGAPFFQVRFCPLVASASSSDRLLLWEATGAAQGSGGPPSLAFLEDLQGSPRGMRGPVLLRPGGKPRVEL